MADKNTHTHTDTIEPPSGGGYCHKTSFEWINFLDNPIFGVFKRKMWAFTDNVIEKQCDKEKNGKIQSNLIKIAHTFFIIEYFR